MEAKELRIGNLVEIGRLKSGDFLVGIVSGVNSNKIGGTVNVENIEREYLAQDLFPIFITEEVLLNFGFEKCEGQFGVYFKSPHDKQVRLYFYDEKWCIGYTVNKKFNTIGSFRHVHKLQNFHYEFVGQELISK